MSDPATDKSQKKLGLTLGFIGALLWGIFPITTMVLTTTLKPLATTALSTLIAALFFAIIITVKKSWDKFYFAQTWRAMVGASLFIGVSYYALIYWASNQTNPGNVAILILMEIPFSILILRYLGHETLSSREIIGALVMISGALFVLIPGWSNPAKSWLVEAALVGATLLPPFVNNLIKEARKVTSAIHLMFMRSLIAGSILLLLSHYLEGSIEISSISEILPLLLFQGIVLMGIEKVAFIESINLIPISINLALHCSSALFTLILMYFFLDHTSTWYQIAAIIPLAIGTYLLSTADETPTQTPL